MKKKLIPIIAVLSFLSIFYGCKKESYIAAFDKSPQERMSDTLNYVRNTLSQSPYGWVVVTPTQFGGGYGFYMKFDDSLNVTMYSDWSTAFANTAKISTTRLRADLGVALSFETYNYISELNDPSNNDLSSKVKQGYGGDVDYIYDYMKGDSLFFRGKRYAKPLIFAKATEAQKDVYTSTNYSASISKFKSFFTSNSNAFITLSDSTKISIDPSSDNTVATGKRITFIAVDSNGAVKSTLIKKFAYTGDQMAILEAPTIEGKQFVRIAWKTSTTMAIYTSEGEEYIINNGEYSVIPLAMIMGSKYSSLEGGYLIGSSTKPAYPAPGTSTDGATILNYYFNNLKNKLLVPSTYTNGNLTLIWNTASKRVTLRGTGYISSGAGYLTDIVYNYAIDSTYKYTFTLYTGASFQNTAKILVPIDDFLQKNTISLEYYKSGGKTYGLLRSVEKPTTALSFYIVK